MEIQNVGTTNWWDNYFMPGGGWEKNNGRFQTKIFAEKFIRYSKIDVNKEFSLLDIGCALGDAIRLFNERYSHGTYFGIDLSTTAIERCKK